MASLQNLHKNKLCLNREYVKRNAPECTEPQRKKEKNYTADLGKSRLALRLSKTLWVMNVNDKYLHVRKLPSNLRCHIARNSFKIDLKFNTRKYWKQYSTFQTRQELVLFPLSLLLRSQCWSFASRCYIQCGFGLLHCASAVASRWPDHCTSYVLKHLQSIEIFVRFQRSDKQDAVNVGLGGSSDFIFLHWNWFYLRRWRDYFWITKPKYS